MEKTIEEKIYEMFGIKKFKKLVIGIQRKIRGKKGQDKIVSIDNYFINEKTKEGLEKYQTNGILINLLIHFPLLLKSIETLVGSSNNVAGILLSVIGIVINTYCIVLQRYNQIRINRTIKKLEAREDKQYKKELQEKLSYFKSLDKVNVVDKNIEKSETTESILLDKELKTNDNKESSLVRIRK